MTTLEQSDELKKHTNYRYLIKTLYTVQLFMLHKLHVLTTNDPDAQSPIEEKIQSIITNYSLIFCYTFTIHEELYPYLILIQPKRIESIIADLKQKQSEVEIPVFKQAIVENNIIRLEYILVDFQGMTIEECLNRSKALFRIYLLKLNEIYKAGKFEEVKKGEWRAIDGYVVMAAEICMVGTTLLHY